MRREEEQGIGGEKGNKIMKGEKERRIKRSEGLKQGRFKGQGS